MVSDNFFDDSIERKTRENKVVFSAKRKMFEKNIYIRFLFDISNGTLQVNRQPLNKANL